MKTTTASMVHATDKMPTVATGALVHRAIRSIGVSREGRTRKACMPGFFLQAALLSALWPSSVSAAKSSYPAMAPVDRYLMSGPAEIALARSAAPQAISSRASVMVLGRKGYAVAAKGTNGFLCIVERSWATPTNDADFWNPAVRAPICFNQSAARTFLPIYLMKTGWALEGETRAGMARAIASAFEERKLPALGPGAMCYMMSKGQNLPRTGRWHPHVMVYASGDAVKSWGANLPGSPVIAASDPEERVTIFMVLADRWSDGSLAAK